MRNREEVMQGLGMRVARGRKAARPAYVDLFPGVNAGGGGEPRGAPGRPAYMDLFPNAPNGAPGRADFQQATVPGVSVPSPGQGRLTPAMLAGASAAVRAKRGGGVAVEDPAAAGRRTNVGMGLPPEFKHGGVVEKTGVAKVHKGEVVVPAVARGSRSGRRKKLRGVRIDVAENGGFMVVREYDGGEEAAAYSACDGGQVVADVVGALGIGGDEEG